LYILTLSQKNTKGKSKPQAWEFQIKQIFRINSDDLNRMLDKLESVNLFYMYDLKGIVEELLIVYLDKSEFNLDVEKIDYINDLLEQHEQAEEARKSKEEKGESLDIDVTQNNTKENILNVMKKISNHRKNNSKVILHKHRSKMTYDTSEITNIVSSAKHEGIESTGSKKPHIFEKDVTFHMKSIFPKFAMEKGNTQQPGIIHSENDSPLRMVKATSNSDNIQRLKSKKGKISEYRKYNREFSHLYDELYTKDEEKGLINKNNTNTIEGKDNNKSFLPHETSEPQGFRYYKKHQKRLNLDIKQVIIRYFHLKESLSGKKLAFFSLIFDNNEGENLAYESIYKSLISYIFRRLISVNGKFCYNPRNLVPLTNLTLVKLLMSLLKQEKHIPLIKQVFSDLMLNSHTSSKSKAKEEKSNEYLQLRHVNSELINDIVIYIFCNFIYAPVVVQLVKEMEIWKNIHCEENVIYFLPYEMLSFLELLSTNDYFSMKELKKLITSNKLIKRSRLNSVSTKQQYFSKPLSVSSLLCSVNFFPLVQDHSEYIDVATEQKVEEKKKTNKNLFQIRMNNNKRTIKESKKSIQLKSVHHKLSSDQSMGIETKRFLDEVSDYKYQYIGVFIKVLNMIKENVLSDSVMNVNTTLDYKSVAHRIEGGLKFNKNFQNMTVGKRLTTNLLRIDYNKASNSQELKSRERLAEVKNRDTELSVNNLFLYFNRYLSQIIKLSGDNSVKSFFTSMSFYSKNYNNMSSYYFENFSFVKYSMEMKKFIYRLETILMVKTKLINEEDSENGGEATQGDSKKNDIDELNRRASQSVQTIKPDKDNQAKFIEIDGLENIFNKEYLEIKLSYFQTIENLLVKNNQDIVEIFSGIFPIEELLDYSLLLLKMVLLNKKHKIKIPEVCTFDKLNNPDKYSKSLMSYLKKSMSTRIGSEEAEYLQELFLEEQFENNLYFKLGLKISMIIYVVCFYFDNPMSASLSSTIKSLSNIDEDQTKVNPDHLDFKYYFKFLDSIVKTCEFVLDLSKSNFQNGKDYLEHLEEDSDYEHEAEKTLKKVLFCVPSALPKKALPSIKEILSMNISDEEINNNSNNIVSHTEVLNTINNISKDLAFEIIYNRSMMKRDKRYKKIRQYELFFAEYSDDINLYLIILTNIILLVFYNSSNTGIDSAYTPGSLQSFLQDNFLIFNYFLSLLQMSFNLVNIVIFMKVTRIFKQKLEENRENRNPESISHHEMSFKRDFTEEKEFMFGAQESLTEKDFALLKELIDNVNFDIDGLKSKGRKASKEKNIIVYQIIVLKLLLCCFKSETRTKLIFKYFIHLQTLRSFTNKYISKGILDSSCNIPTFNFIIPLLILMNRQFIFLYPIQIFSLIKYIPTLKEIAKAFYLKITNIIAMILFLIILVNFFSAIGFFFIYNKEVSSEEDSIFATDDDKNPSNYCQSMLECFIFYLSVGVRAGGGVGDATRPKYFGEEGFFIQFLIDLLFYISIIVILLNMINGIIISTFSYLRSERDQMDSLMSESCLVCFLTQNNFERKNKSFDSHRKFDHNVYSYIRFLVNIQLKEEKNMNEFEIIILNKLKANSISYFPIKKCISMPESDLEGSDED